jgi:hypothetical protein
MSGSITEVGWRFQSLEINDLDDTNRGYRRTLIRAGPEARGEVSARRQR